MSLFMYAIEVWACAYDGKYLSQIDKFINRAVTYGYTNKRPSIAELVTKDTKLWSKIKVQNHCLNDLLPPQKTHAIPERGHNYILPQVRSERFKRCFINRWLFVAIEFSSIHTYIHT